MQNEMKEIKNHLKNWKLMENKYSSLSERQNLKEINNSKNNDWSDIEKQEQIECYYKAFVHALTVLEKLEYDVIYAYYYKGWSDKKSMNELFLSRATYYRVKKRAVCKLTKTNLLDLKYPK